MAPAAAERDGLKDGQVWDWEGRRERRIELLDGVLKRVRTWRDAEIKMRRGMLEKKPIEEPLGDQKEDKWNDNVESEISSPKKRKRRHRHLAPWAGEQSRMPSHVDADC